MAVDITYESHTEDASYRLRPNPDCPAGQGFKYGAVLEWTDDGKEWKGYFFIAPEAIKDLAEMFTKAEETT